MLTRTYIFVSRSTLNFYCSEQNRLHRQWLIINIVLTLAHKTLWTIQFFLVNYYSTTDRESLQLHGMEIRLQSSKAKLFRCSRRWIPKECLKLREPAKPNFRPRQEELRRAVPPFRSTRQIHLAFTDRVRDETCFRKVAGRIRGKKNVKQKNMKSKCKKHSSLSARDNGPPFDHWSKVIFSFWPPALSTPWLLVVNFPLRRNH